MLPKAMRGISRCLGRLAPELVALSMVSLAFALAIGTTGDLSWPPKDDFFREIGATQTILDGFPGADPAYLAEEGWYNPLLPRVMAFLASHSDLPLPELYVRAGPYLNLLVPVGFYVLAAVLFGRWAAVASLGVFLFTVSPLLPPRVLASYSPWLWARNFTQGLFYLSTAAAVLAFRTHGVLWALAAGFGAGLTFLGHTAPALVFVLFASMLWAEQLVRSIGTDRSVAIRASTTFLIIGSASIAVSSFFLFQLLFGHGLEVKNWAPSNLIGLYGRQILKGFLSLRTALAVLGGIALVRSPAAPKNTLESRSVPVMLLLATLVPLAYGFGVRYATQAGLELRQLVPEFHFHIYFTAVQALFAGVGLCALAHRISPTLARWTGSAPGVGWMGSPATFERFVLSGLIVGAIASGFGGYLSSPDLHAFREESLRRGRKGEVRGLYEWVLRHTSNDDVFLVEPKLGFFAVGSAARKVVLLPESYSNPYVDYAERRADQDRMYALLRDGDLEAFFELAARYEVDFVVAQSDGQPCCSFEPIRHPRLRGALEIEGLTVYEVRGPGVGED